MRVLHGNDGGGMKHRETLRTYLAGNPAKGGFPTFFGARRGR